jgi:hypothetical protein
MRRASRAVEKRQQSGPRAQSRSNDGRPRAPRGACLREDMVQ